MSLWRRCFSLKNQADNANWLIIMRNLALKSARWIEMQAPQADTFLQYYCEWPNSYTTSGEFFPCTPWTYHDGPAHEKSEVSASNQLQPRGGGTCTNGGNSAGTALRLACAGCCTIPPCYSSDLAFSEAFVEEITESYHLQNSHFPWKSWRCSHISEAVVAQHQHWRPDVFCTRRVISLACQEKKVRFQRLKVNRKARWAHIQREKDPAVLQDILTHSTLFYIPFSSSIRRNQVFTFFLRVTWQLFAVRIALPWCHSTVLQCWLCERFKISFPRASCTLAGW